MRKLTLTLLSIALCLGVVTTYAGQETADKSPGYVIGRGFGNILTGWLEVPRGIVYENARIPVVGLISGPVKGLGLTAWRGLAGVTDVLTFGLIPEGLYGSYLPDFVWEDAWLPREEVPTAVAPEDPYPFSYVVTPFRMGYMRVIKIKGEDPDSIVQEIVIEEEIETAE